MANKITTQLVIDGKNKAGAAFKEANSQINNLADSAKKAGAFLAGALAVGALAGFVKQSIDAADASRKSAQAVGLATEEYTALQYAAKLAGVGTGELDAGLSKLNRTIAGAANGGKAQLEAFDRLGVSVLDAGGKIKASDQILAEVADKFQALPDGVQKSSAAMELFGRSGARLIPLLNAGSAGLEELRKEAEAMGVVISDTSAAQAEVFNDNITRLGEASAGAGNQIAAEMLPSLVDLSELLVDLNKNSEATSVIANVLAGAMKVLATVAIVVGTAFTATGGAIAGVAAAIAAAARGDFSQAKQILLDAAADYEKGVRSALDRTGKLWSGAGAATAAAAVEQKKQQAVMTGDLKATTDQMAAELKQQVRNAQDALKARVAAERTAAKELEKAKQAQLDTEKRYTEALAKLRAGGAGDPSFGQFQSLKVSARQDLQAGNVDAAKEKAQAALEVLNQLAAAGENTYGFEGFINELRAIEEGADQINVDKAAASFDSATAEAAKLKAMLDELKDVKITIDLPPSELERIKGLLEQLQVVITPKIALPNAGEADADGYVFVPNLPAVPGFARGTKNAPPGMAWVGENGPELVNFSGGEQVLTAAASQNLMARLAGLNMPDLRGDLAESLASAAPAAPRFPHLGRLDINAAGQTIPAYIDLDFAKKLRRTATKFGGTHK